MRLIPSAEAEFNERLFVQESKLHKKCLLANRFRGLYVQSPTSWLCTKSRYRLRDMADTPNPPELREPTLDELLAIMHATDRQFWASGSSSPTQREDLLEGYKAAWRAKQQLVTSPPSPEPSESKPKVLPPSKKKSARAGRKRSRNKIITLPPTPSSLHAKLSEVIRGNPFWSAIGMIVGGIGAYVSSAFLVLAGWIVLTVVICRADFFEGKANKTRWVGNATISLIIASVLILLLIALRPKQENVQTVQTQLTPTMQPGLRSFLIPDNYPTPPNPCGSVPPSEKIALVGSLATTFPQELKSFSLIRIGGEDVLSVEENAPSGIVINAVIRNENNELVATITKNIFHSYAPNDYDVRSNDHSIQIIDSHDVMILYVRYLNPQAIKVLGTFRSADHRRVRVDEGRFFIGAQENDMMVCNHGGGTDKDWWKTDAVLLVE
jgi:hypothetical protein